VCRYSDLICSTLSDLLHMYLSRFNVKIPLLVYGLFLARGSQRMKGKLFNLANFPFGSAQNYMDSIRISPPQENVWVDQTENISGVFLHRSIRLDIFVSDQIMAQQRIMIAYLDDENLNCIERPLKSLNGGDIVLTHSSALILRKDSELELTSTSEPTGTWLVMSFLTPLKSGIVAIIANQNCRC
jgi:hypothetical protein